MVIIKTIDAKVLSRMFLAGAKNLEAKKEWINELNVFPVPDGDTGTNMTMTIMSAAAEVTASGRPGYGNPGKSNFFRFSYVEQEETPVLSFPSSSGASPKASGSLKNWMQSQSPLQWSVQWKQLTKLS